MTTGYLAEVDTPEGTRYIKNGSKLSKLPFFFAGRASMRRAMKPHRWYAGADRYDERRDALKTVVIEVSGIEKGLRASEGRRMTVFEFNALPLASTSPKYPKGAVFKLGLQDGRYQGGGRLGKVWESAGHLRNHLTQNIEKFATQYKNAVVTMIEYESDMITPRKITRYPAIEFYRASPYSNKQYMNAYRSTLADFSATPRSTYG